MLEPGPCELMIQGKTYLALKRAAFGQMWQQHVICGHSFEDSKIGFVIAHSDYTVCICVCDSDAATLDGELATKMKQMMASYKAAGF